MTASSPHRDAEQIRRALDSIGERLAQAATELAALYRLLDLAVDSPVDFDPKDAANKHHVGGLEKLTPRGVEICYRLFDAGKSRYAVAQALDISFGAATHRYGIWQKAGAVNRVREPLA